MPKQTHFYKIRPGAALPAWSMSRYSTWKQCPFKLYLTAVERRKEPKNPAMLRGQEIHDLAERFIKGTIAGDVLPAELVKYESYFWHLREEYAAGNVDAENKEALTQSWEATEFFDDDVWLRVVKDVRVVIADGEVRLIDWKTGKKRDGYEDQLELYAASEPTFVSHLKKIHVALCYLDQGQDAEVETTYTVREAELLRQKWHAEGLKVTGERRFEATPNNLCTWCHFRRDNGGPCVY